MTFSRSVQSYLPRPLYSYLILKLILPAKFCRLWSLYYFTTFRVFRIFLTLTAFAASLFISSPSSTRVQHKVFPFSACQICLT
ncbi:hypothetical protein BGZ57DRAFT_904285 [Hyaloscypha finlandica]|nr:hypothetical protein BGZ57DRAFT_904285 [Hyaloscypha finlandica]